MVFDVIEYCLGLDLPDYVHEDPVFIIAYLAAADLTAFKTLLLITVTYTYFQYATILSGSLLI